ncbi:hypothetical protein [Methylorubrum sp. SB2]|uniref:hypothetical protein n=1 Tax=Methylorubrum subtropicum TaxID=3138812 RepID=UPI00313F345A
MLYDKMSTNGLRALHGGITRALADDDAQPPHRRVYGVRKYPDWRDQADRIEAELTARREAFAPVRW